MTAPHAIPALPALIISKAMRVQAQSVRTIWDQIEPLLIKDSKDRSYAERESLRELKKEFADQLSQLMSATWQANPEIKALLLAPTTSAVRRDLLEQVIEREWSQLIVGTTHDTQWLLLRDSFPNWASALSTATPAQR